MSKTSLFVRGKFLELHLDFFSCWSHVELRSGMFESEGWGASKSACTRVALSSSQGEDGCPSRSWPRAYLYWFYPCLPSAGSLWMWSGHHSLLSMDLLVRIGEVSCDLPTDSLDL